MNLKKKNDERFEIITGHLEGFNRLLIRKGNKEPIKKKEKGT